MSTPTSEIPQELSDRMDQYEPVKVEGAHVSVHVGTWTGKRSFEKSEFRNKDGKGIESRTAPMQVYTIDCPELKRVQTIGQNIRKNLDSRLHSLQMATVNTHITGEGVGQGRRIKTRFIPMARLAAWWRRHQALKKSFDKAVDAFIAVYEEARKSELPRLQKDGLADQIKWPTVETLRSHFYITEDIRVASWETNMAESISEYAEKQGNKSEVEVLNELAQAQEVRLRHEIGKAADQLASALAENMEQAYSEMLAILQKKANGERTKLCIARVSEFLEFFTACRALNVSNNKRLNEAISTVENLISTYGVNTPERFKDTVDADPQGLAMAFSDALQEVVDPCSEVQRDLIL